MSLPREMGIFFKELAKGPGAALKHHRLLTLLFVASLAAFGWIAVYRFQHGLGVTGINDETPWGIWTALKLTLVVWSGCAFVLTGMVYVFKLEGFRPLVRAAALMGLLGYSAFALILIFELGWPWRIVHPIWMHNYTSILFEIAWCVMLYLTVLSLEFMPNVFERFKMTWMYHGFKKITPALVIAGIVLSVLHQSSLGSLFVMVPYSMNPLWYTPWIGAFFIISAIFCGYAMIIACELIMARFDKRAPRMDLLTELAKFCLVFLSLYLGFKVMDILERAPARSAFVRFDTFTLLYAVEIGLGIVLPIILLSIRKVRHSRTGLGLATSLVLLFGGALNRLNVSVLSIDHSPLGYVPTVVEGLYIPTILILVAGIFIVITRLFPIFDPSENH